MNATRIEPEELTTDGWRPFGWLPVPDTDPADGEERLAFDWGNVHVNLLGHDLDEVPIVPGGLRCQVLFRHATHTQTLMAMDHSAVIVVAPAGADPRSPAGSASIRAFALPVLCPVVLHRGTWHWGPYPVGSNSVRLFNVQGLRYREDNDSVDLLTAGSPVDVVLG
ncbi:MAG: ureidoglycolate lyase [Acidimicrobiales bacterium]